MRKPLKFITGLVMVTVLALWGLVHFGFWTDGFRQLSPEEGRQRFDGIFGYDFKVTLRRDDVIRNAAVRTISQDGDVGWWFAVELSGERFAELKQQLKTAVASAPDRWVADDADRPFLSSPTPRWLVRYPAGPFDTLSISALKPMTAGGAYGIMFIPDKGIMYVHVSR